MFSDMKLERALKRVKKLQMTTTMTNKVAIKMRHRAVMERSANGEHRCIQKFQIYQNKYSVILQRENYIKCQLFHWKKK